MSLLPAASRERIRFQQDHKLIQPRQLLSRLGADDLSHSRAFTTAINSTKRPATSSKVVESAPVRHFNTSRAMKANHDTSTIDFAYLPELEDGAAGLLNLRVPLLPTQFFPGKGHESIKGHQSIEETGEAVSCFSKPPP